MEKERNEDNGKTVTLRLTYFGSTEYWAGIYLRNELLKKTANTPLISELPLEEQDNWHVVVLEDERVVGTLMLSEWDNKTMKIQQVAIDPSMQGQGLGLRLMAFAEQLAKELGFKKTYLTGRESAWRFYEQLGYLTNHDIITGKGVLLKEFEKKLTHNTYLKEMETNG